MAEEMQTVMMENVGIYRNETNTVEVAHTDRLLDALITIKQFQDGTLGFRKSCAHGVCGSDAMRINHDPVPEKERLQSPEGRMKFDDTTNCILCASCYSACPIFDKNKNFPGPAALSQGESVNDGTTD